MSENKELNPIEKMKEIAETKNKNLSGLMSDIKSLKSKMNNALQMLSQRKQEIKANEQEVQSTDIPVISDTIKTVENDTETVNIKKEEKTVSETSENVVKETIVESEINTEKTEKVESEIKQTSDTTNTPQISSENVVAEKSTDTQTTSSNTYNKNSDGRPQFNNNRPNDGRPQYNNNRPNDGRPQYNNNRLNDGRPQYNNNRLNDGRPQYNNNRPNDGRPQYNNNRPNDGRPQFNNNRPNDGRPQFNNNRPNDGRPQFNNNRPAGSGGFSNPRLPKADMALPIAKEMPKKKKSFDKDATKKQQPANKKTNNLRKGFYDVGMDDAESARYHKQRKIKKQNDFTPNTVNIEHAIVTTQLIPVKVLADKIGKAAVEIVKKMFALGQLVTVNDSIEFDTAELIALDFGITLEYKPETTAEDKLNAIILDREVEGELVKRPPIVTIMGHVDHGKTSLLDKIRNSKVASGEAGGITQHIGAYTIDLNGEPITFLDTPGHEAFTSMRKRGAMVTDIAIIVVAADDGIMPQTVEAIHHAKEAGVSIMIAVNKIDKPTANLDKIMQQLTQHDCIPEAWGGDIMVCPVSAKTGEGIESLLESILLLAEVKELKAVKDCRASGTIVEARLDKGIGPVATSLVQNGTLKVGDYVVAGTCVGRVRALIDNSGKRIKEAGPSIAVAVQGFNDVPNAGDQLIVVKDEKLAKQVAQDRANKDREDMQRKSASRSLEDMFKNYSSEDRKSLGVIIKGDVQGSVEAVKQALIALSDSMEKDGVSITVMHAAVGAINESDVMLADTGNAVVIGFNVRPEPKARQLSEKSGVDIKIYRIIYDVIDDVTKALKGMLKPIFREEVLGHAEIRETFRITGVGMIAGCYVTDGKIARNAKFRLIRDNIVVYDGEISSMKRNKDEAKEVSAGYECGIGLQNYNDMKVGDMIEAFLVKEEER